jgi:hypothetical protein
MELPDAALKIGAAGKWQHFRTFSKDSIMPQKNLAITKYGTL